MDPIKRLADYWSSHALVPNRRATIEKLRIFESTNRVIFPDDFKEYLLQLDGLDYQGVDHNGFSFMSLAQLREVKPSEYPPGFSGKGFYVFADYLHWSWGYAVQLADEHTLGHVIHVGTLEPKLVATSFSAFIDLYIVDSPELYPTPHEDAIM
jgi:hypothetical protein